MKTIAIIPARLESSRLPNKLLLSETGKPLIQHTCEAAQRAVDAGVIDSVQIVTDSKVLFRLVDNTKYKASNIFAFLRNWNFEVRNGTERIARFVHTKMESPRVFINWQADEPELTPEHIQALKDAWHANPRCDYATLVADDLKGEDFKNENTVKALVRTVNSSAADVWAYDRVVDQLEDHYHRHIGAYAYDARYLEWYLSTPPSEREQSESLEQLRLPQARCHAAVIENAPHGINTRADYDAFCERMKAVK